MIRDKRKIIIEEDALTPEEQERYKNIVAEARQDAHKAHLFFKEQELGKKSKVFLLQLWELLDKALTVKSRRI